MTDRALNYQIDGNNRGGTVHAELLLRKLPDRKRNLNVVLNDIEPGRADKLARRLAERGILVAPHERAASVSPDADIHTLSVDNPAPVVPILHSAVRSPLLEIGQLVAPSPSGGSIFGIAVVLTDSDPSKRSDALHIFSRLASLAGERKSSRVMSSPIRHSVQMSPIRNVMHDYLTDKSLQFMENGLVPAELRFFDGLNRASYPVETVEAGRRIKRRDLKGATVSDLAPAGVNGNFCVVFYDQSEAWLYAVFATTRGDRARVVNSIEIPRMEPAPPSLSISAAWPHPHRQEQRQWWEILITD